VLRGVQHIKQGDVHTLQVQMGHPHGDPVWPGRSGIDRSNVMDESNWDGADAPRSRGLHYADDKATLFLQGSTQYDALVTSVRRPDLERLRLPQHRRGLEQGLRVADREKASSAAAC